MVSDVVRLSRTLLGVCPPLAAALAAALTLAPFPSNAGTPLATGPADQRAPAAGWSPASARWLVAWQDHAPLPPQGVAIGAVRVDAAGAPVESPWLLAGDEQDRLNPAVAGGGSPGGWLVVYEREGPGGGLDVAARFVRADGALPAAELTLAGGSDWEYDPAVAWSAALCEYLAIWSAGPAPLSGQSDLWARRVGADGALLGPAVRLTSDDGREDEASVVANAGAGWLVAWRAADGPAPTRPDVFAMPLGPTGAPNGPAFAVAASLLAQQRPRLAARPGSADILAVWQDGLPTQDGTISIVAQRVRADSGPVDNEVSLAELGTEEEGVPAAAWLPGPGAWLLGWDAFASPGDRDLFVRMLLADAMPREYALPVVTTAAWEGSPDLAADGFFGALLVWEDASGGPAAGLDVHGEVLSPGVVSGQVFLGDPPSENRPLPQVKVSLYGSRTYYTFERPLVSDYTDAEGRFWLPFLEPWPYYQLYKVNPAYFYSRAAASDEGWVVPSGTGADWISFGALESGEHGGNRFWVVSAAHVVDVEPPAASGTLALSAPWPNPTSGAVSLQLRGGLTAHDRVEVFDARGRLVRQWHGERPLQSAAADAGAGGAVGAAGPVGAPGGGPAATVAADGELRWDGRLAGGESAPAGLYVVRVRNGEQTAVRKVIVGMR